MKLKHWIFLIWMKVFHQFDKLIFLSDNVLSFLFDNILICVLNKLKKKRHKYFKSTVDNLVEMTTKYCNLVVRGCSSRSTLEFEPPSKVLGGTKLRYHRTTTCTVKGDVISCWVNAICSFIVLNKGLMFLNPTVMCHPYLSIYLFIYLFNKKIKKKKILLKWVTQ